jgi:prepilin-type N-terminal cleavage/methylation domain-containing protein
MVLRNTNHPARRRRRAGFTLAELLAVVAILAILSGVAIFGFKEIIGNARVRTATAECRSLSSALKTFATAHVDDFPSTQGFPDPSSGFDVLLQTAMVDRVPTDPWRNPYYWELVANPVSGILEPIVHSAGPDGAPGTGDDISSAQQ